MFQTPILTPYTEPEPILEFYDRPAPRWVTSLALTLVFHGSLLFILTIPHTSVPPDEPDIIPVSVIALRSEPPAEPEVSPPRSKPAPTITRPPPPAPSPPEIRKPDTPTVPPPLPKILSTENPSTDSDRTVPESRILSREEAIELGILQPLPEPEPEPEIIPAPTPVPTPPVPVPEPIIQAPPVPNLRSDSVPDPSPLDSTAPGDGPPSPEQEEVLPPRPVIDLQPPPPEESVPEPILPEIPIAEIPVEPPIQEPEQPKPSEPVARIIAPPQPKVLASPEAPTTAEEAAKAVPETQAESGLDFILRNPATRSSGGGSGGPVSGGSAGRWNLGNVGAATQGGLRGVYRDVNCREPGRDQTECPGYVEGPTGRNEDGWESWSNHRIDLGSGPAQWGTPRRSTRNPASAPAGARQQDLATDRPSTTVLDDVNHFQVEQVPERRIRDLVSEEKPPAPQPSN